MGYLGTGVSAQSVGPVQADNESASQIRDQISAAEQTLSELHDHITALERRCETVLTSQPPMPATASTPRDKVGPGSHVLGRLVILNEGFRAACERLISMGQRVEV